MNCWMKLFLDFVLKCIDLANVAHFFWMKLTMSKYSYHQYPLYYQVMFIFQ